MFTQLGIKKATISVVVTRANGQIEDYGVVSRLGDHGKIKNFFHRIKLWIQQRCR